MKIITKIPLLFTILVCTWLESCTPVMYSSLGHNTPMFQEKGEVLLSLAYARSETDYLSDNDGSGVAFQAANSLNDKLAWHTSLYFLNNTSTNRSPDYWKSNGNYFEAGLGRYGTFAEKKFGYEIFGGLGYGGVRNAFGPEKVNAKFIKPYIQPSIGYLSPFFDIVLTPRLGMVSYLSNEVFGTDMENINMAETFFSEKNGTLVFEPGITLRGGYRGMKLQIQYSYSTFSDVDDIMIGVNNQYISLGAYFLLSNRYEK